MSAYKNLFLPRVLPRPIRVLLEAVRVQRAPHITTTARIFVVVPCAPNTRALLEDDEVVAFVAFDEVDGHAHALKTSVVGFQSHWVRWCLRGGWLRFWGELTRDPSADDDDRGGGVGFIAHGDFGPWFGAAHVVYTNAGKVFEMCVLENPVYFL